MFRVVHTTPKRVLSHLFRLKREGEALLDRPFLDPLAEAKWADRMFRYLKRIAEDPETYDRVLWNQLPRTGLLEGLVETSSPQERTKVRKKQVEAHLVTLAGAIEQFEAQYELDP